MAYYPYLRGRQYELFALRELLSLNALSPSVVPIVEPVKDNDLLKQVIRQFVDGGRKIAVVMNPGVGCLRTWTEGLMRSSISMGKKCWNMMLQVEAHW